MRWPEWVSLGAEVGVWGSEWVCHLVKCLTLQQLINPRSFGGTEEEELLGWMCNWASCTYLVPVLLALSLGASLDATMVAIMLMDEWAMSTE